MKLTHRLAALAAGAAVALAGGPAFATQTRVDSMGGGVKQITVDDEVNVFDFPALLVRYGNMTHIDNLTLDVAADGTPYPNMRFGYHAQLTDDMVLGVYGGAISNVTRGPGDGYDIAGNVFTGRSGLGPGEQADGASTGAAAQPTGTGLDTSVDFTVGLMYALRIGTDVRLGLSLAVLASNNDTSNEQVGGLANPPVVTDNGAFLIDLGLGFGLDLEALELDISLAFEFGDADDFRDVAQLDANQVPVTVPGPNGTTLGVNALGVEHWSVDSHIAVRLAARAVIDFVGDSSLVPYLKFNYAAQSMSHQYVVDPNGSNQPLLDWSGIEFVLGTDFRVEPFEDIVVTPGLGVRVASQSLSESVIVPDPNGTGFNIEQTTFQRDGNLLLSLPYYGVGVDLKIFDWMDFRFGAHQSVDLITETTTNPAGLQNTANTTRVVTHIATGIGLNLPVSESVLKIDINVNPLHFLTGPYLWTGNATPGVIGGGAGNFGLSAAIQYDW